MTTPDHHNPHHDEHHHESEAHRKLHEHKKNAAERNYTDIDFHRYVTASFVLCATRSALLHPLFMVVTRRQACSHSNGSFLNIAREMRRTEGGALRAFTQGLPAMVIGMALSESIFNAVYEYGRFELQELELMSCATATASAAWFADWSSRIFFSPFNVIAVRQTMFNSASSAKGNLEIGMTHNNFSHVVSRLYQQPGGLKNFYAGFGLVLCVGSFTSSIFFVTYTQLKLLFYGFATPYLERKEAEYRKRCAADAAAASGIVTPQHRWLPATFYSSTDNLLLNSAASLCGSALASTIINPYYVLLAKRQSGISRSIREAAESVYKAHGWRGFFRGATGAMALGMFDTLLFSTTYEAAIAWSMRT